MKFLNPTNTKVLAFIRRNEREHILVVANLSRFAQPVELDLSEYKEALPVEMFGNVHFPAVGDTGHYSLSVGSHAFYWFVLKRTETPVTDISALPPVSIGVGGELALSSGLGPGNRSPFALDLAQATVVLSPKPNPSAQTRVLAHVDRAAKGDLPDQCGIWRGRTGNLCLPLSIQTDASAAGDDTSFLHIVSMAGKHWIVTDGLRDIEFARLLLQMAMDGREITESGLRLEGRLIGANAAPLPGSATLAGKVPKIEQSNSNVVFGDQLIFRPLPPARRGDQS